MSKRHQKAQGSVVPESRDQRKVEHRKVRHAAKQQLHVAAVEADGDELGDLIVPTPHATHGYSGDHEEPLSHSIADPSNRVRHWKQPFWKRRKLDRRRKAAQIETDLRKA